jgi:hypothetical protein
MKIIANLAAIAVIVITSCTHDVKTPQNNNGNNSNSTSVTGNFIITKFTDDDAGEDKTADFNGYTFVFTADGKISALKNGVATPGSYTEKPSHEGEGAKLNINFSNAPLNELNKNWLINFISDEAIHLRDDNAPSGEVLEFTAQ